MVKELETEFEKVKKAIFGRFSEVAPESALKAFVAEIESYHYKADKIFSKHLERAESMKEENDILRSISGIDEFSMKAKFLEKAAETKFLREQLLDLKKTIDAMKKDKDDARLTTEEYKQENEKKFEQKDREYKVLSQELEDIKGKLKHFSDNLDKNRESWQKEREALIKKNQDYEAYVRQVAVTEAEAVSARLRDLCGVLAGTTQYCMEKWGEIKQKKSKTIRGMLSGKNNRLLSEISPDMAVMDDISSKITRTLDLYQGLLELPRPTWEKIMWPGFWDALKRKYYELQVKKQIKISFPQEKKFPNFVSDETVLTQIIDVLVQNAVESVIEKGAIEITGKFDEEETALNICDTGKIISRANRDKIFLPFFTTRAGHDGLGLTKAMKLVETLGGRIKYEPIQTGNMFVLTIPGHKL